MTYQCPFLSHHQPNACSTCTSLTGLSTNARSRKLYFPKAKVSCRQCNKPALIHKWVPALSVINITNRVDLNKESCSTDAWYPHLHPKGHSMLYYVASRQFIILQNISHQQQTTMQYSGLYAFASNARKYTILTKLSYQI